MKLVFNGNGTTIETFDIIKQQKERLENEYQKKIQSMEEQMKKMSEMLMQITTNQTEEAIAKRNALQNEETIAKTITTNYGKTLTVSQTP